MHTSGFELEQHKIFIVLVCKKLNFEGSTREEGNKQQVSVNGIFDTAFVDIKYTR